MAETEQHKISFEDIRRLLTELQEMDERDESRIAEWLPNHGFDDEVMGQLAEYGFAGLGAVLTGFIEADTDDDESNSIGFLPPEVFQSAIAAIAIGLFQIGWEAHEQLGGGSDVGT